MRVINSLKMGMERLIMHEMRNSSPESLLTSLGLCDYSPSTHYGTSWAATVLYNAHGQGSQIPRALSVCGIQIAEYF